MTYRYINTKHIEFLDSLIDVEIDKITYDFLHKDRSKTEEPNWNSPIQYLHNRQRSIVTKMTKEFLPLLQKLPSDQLQQIVSEVNNIEEMRKYYYLKYYKS